MWEEEYYIFDSETISENEFDEKVEYEDYKAFADSMLGDEVVELLNELHEENKILTDAFEQHLKRKGNRIKELKKENEQLRQQLIEKERLLDVRDKIIADVMKAVNGDVE